MKIIELNRKIDERTIEIFLFESFYNSNFFNTTEKYNVEKYINKGIEFNFKEGSFMHMIQITFKEEMDMMIFLMEFL